MAQNPLPKPTGALLILAGKCEAGLTTYATPLGITQITPASLAADAAALSTAVGDFNATREACASDIILPLIEVGGNIAFDAQ